MSLFSHVIWARSPALRFGVSLYLLCMGLDCHLAEAESLRIGAVIGRAVEARRAGNYETAEADFRAVVVASQKAQFDSLVGPLALRGLAAVLAGSGKFSESISVYNKVLEDSRSRYGSADLVVSDDLLDLASAYLASGRPKEAGPLIDEARKIRQAGFGVNHPEYARVLSAQGDLQQFEGQYAEARDSYRRSLQLYKTAFGKRHISAARELSRLAVMDALLGNYQEAEHGFEWVRSVFDLAHAGHSPEMVGVLRALAALNKIKRDYAKARGFYLQGVEICQTAYGPESVETAEALFYLAGLLRLEHDKAQAESLISRALGIARPKLGPEHPLVERLVRLEQQISR